MSKFGFGLKFLLCLWITGSYFAYTAVRGSVQTEDPHAFKTAPNPDTPIELQKTWLRFNEDNLCQKVDAVFLFHGKKMQVWTIYEGKKNYMKLVKLLQPLQNSYEVTLYKIYLKNNKKIADIRTPPPSLWENSELSGYFRSSFSHPPVSVDQKLPYFPLNPVSQTFYQQNRSMFGTGIPLTYPKSSWVYSQRLTMFATNILEYADKAKQYSNNLLPLSQVAFNPDAESELRRHAFAICKKHAQELQKYINRLDDDLSKALPKASKYPQVDRTKKSTIENGSPLDLALLLIRETNNLSDQVYRFLFPKNHTVSVADLKNPPLMRSLETLSEIITRFRDIVNASSRDLAGI